jgi:hypothetical protein
MLSLGEMNNLGKNRVKCIPVSISARMSQIEPKEESSRTVPRMEIDWSQSHFRNAFDSISPHANFGSKATAESERQSRKHSNGIPVSEPESKQQYIGGVFPRNRRHLEHLLGAFEY